MIQQNIQHIENCLQQLKHASRAGVCDEFDSIKSSLQDAICQANMIRKAADRAQGELNDLYTRLVDPNGWDPDAPATPQRAEVATSGGQGTEFMPPQAAHGEWQDQTCLPGDIRHRAD
jgi:hypothetical protein